METVIRDMRTLTEATARRIPLKQDLKTSAEIMKIRIKAGGSTSRCPVCNQPADRPYRRIIKNKIVEGCVDAIHTEHLSPTNNTGAWHFRNEARILRRQELGRLRQVNKRKK